MADTEKWYLTDEKEPSLRSWIFQHMAMGAVYAGLVLFGLIAFILVLRALSGLLPEDPFAMLETAKAVLTA